MPTHIWVVSNLDALFAVLEIIYQQVQAFCPGINRTHIPDPKWLELKVLFLFLFFIPSIYLDYCHFVACI